MLQQFLLLDELNGKPIESTDKPNENLSEKEIQNKAYTCEEVVEVDKEILDGDAIVVKNACTPWRKVR